MKFEIAPKSTETELNWQEAIIYCQFLECDGFCWRLPNKDELNEIYLMGNDFEKDWYWSGTEYNDDFAWYQGFGSGNQINSYKSFNLYVRAIRDL